MRLSVTTIEAYRLWREGDWMPLEDLEARIRGDGEVNEAMLRGTAFHHVIEAPEKCLDYVDGTYRADGWTFSGVEPVLEVLPYDAGAVQEAKATMVVGGVTVSGVADALHGVDVYEAKCTKRVDVDRYMAGFQWRAYLLAFEAQRCHYVLAECKDGKGEREVVVKGAHLLTLYRYPELEHDVRMLVDECADFVRARGLEDYAQDKEDAAA